MSACVNWVLISGAYVPALISDGAGSWKQASATGCASGSVVLDNVDYARFVTAATVGPSSSGTTSGTSSGSVNWPPIFNLSTSDGLAISAAIVGVWLIGWAFRALLKTLNNDGESFSE